MEREDQLQTTDRSATRWPGAYRPTKTLSVQENVRMSHLQTTFRVSCATRCTQTYRI